jgi:hypothetical protein
MTRTLSHSPGRAEREATVSTNGIFVLFPSGTEYRLSEQVPAVGDALKRDGDDWVVATVEKRSDGTAVVTVRPRQSLADSDMSASAV